MEDRRRHDRNTVAFKTEVFSCDKTYKGVIRDISESGAKVGIVPTKNATDFLPETMLDIKFQIPSGETLTLRYEVIWLYSKKYSTDGLKQNNIGVEIIEPSQTLKDYLNSL
jgi:hypothetical protein